MKTTAVGQRILLTAFSLALVFLCAELVLRMVGFRQPKLLPLEVRHTYNLEPHASFLYRGYLPGTFEDFEQPILLNQQGLHDYEYTEARPTPSTYRVMVMGDSYVAALSVPIDQTFHKRIEQKLNKENPLKQNTYQVIAVGKGHSSQKDEAEWLTHFGPDYKPDLVLLLFFCGNDIMENSPELNDRAARFGHFYAEQVIPRKEAFFNRFLFFPHSRVNGLIAESLTSYYCEHLDRFVPSLSEKQLESPELGVYELPVTTEWQEAYRLTDAHLKQFQQTCKEIHATFLLGCLAGPQAVGDTASYKLWKNASTNIDMHLPEKWIQNWCKTNSVPCCDLLPALAKAGTRKVYWRHDGHLNPHGNDVVAHGLYQFIVDEARRESPSTTIQPL